MRLKVWPPCWGLTVIILSCLRNNEKNVHTGLVHTFFAQYFQLKFGWISIYRIHKFLGQLCRISDKRKLGCPSWFLLMPDSSLNSKNLKGHILLQERSCHMVLFCSPLPDGPSKNYVKPNPFHPMKRAYQWCIVIRLCDPSTWEAEGGLWIWDQPNPCSETFCHKIIKQSTETRCGSAHL